MEWVRESVIVNTDLTDVTLLSWVMIPITYGDDEDDCNEDEDDDEDDDDDDDYR